MMKPHAFILPAELALKQGKNMSTFTLLSSMVPSAGESCLSSASALVFNLGLAL